MKSTTRSQPNKHDTGLSLCIDAVSQLIRWGVASPDNCMGTWTEAVRAALKHTLARGPAASSSANFVSLTLHSNPAWPDLEVGREHFCEWAATVAAARCPCVCPDAPPPSLATSLMSLVAALGGSSSASDAALCTSAWGEVEARLAGCITMQQSIVCSLAALAASDVPSGLEKALGCEEGSLDADGLASELVRAAGNATCPVLVGRLIASARGVGGEGVEPWHCAVARANTRARLEERGAAREGGGVGGGGEAVDAVQRLVKEMRGQRAKHLGEMAALEREHGTVHDALSSQVGTLPHTPLMILLTSRRL